MKKLCYLIVAFIALSEAANAQWTQFSVGPSRNLYCVDYFSASVIWIGGQDSAYYSSNGGANWTVHNGVDSLFAFSQIYGPFYDICALTASKAVMTGLLYTGNNDIIYISYNSGQWWNQAYTTAPPTLIDFLNDIDFENSLKGYCVGHDGRIIGSVNGGATWNAVTSPVTAELNCVKFIGNNIYVACGNGTVVRSTNGGTNWNAQSVTGEMIDIGFSGTTGYMAGSAGQLYKSVNSGTSWSAISSPFTQVTAINVIDTNVVLVASQNDLYKTTSGGQYWERFRLNNFRRIRKIDFLNSTTGICVGDSGYAIRTTNLAGSYPYSIFTAAANTVCAGNTIQFSNHSDPAFNTRWLLDNIQVSTSYNSTITFPNPGNHTVSLVSQNANGNDTLSALISVTALPSVQNFALNALSDTICPGTSTTISIVNSQQNVQYKLRNQFTQIGSTQNGNGSTLTFSTGNLSATTLLNVLGTMSGSCGTDTDKINITIYIDGPSPSTSFSLAKDSICAGDSTELIVLNSQAGWNYKFDCSNLSGTNNPVPGTGGTIHIPLPIVNANTFIIRLRVISPNGCSTLLSPPDTLRSVNPYLSFSPSRGTIMENDTVTFHAGYTLPTMNWNFGPGTTPSTFTGQVPPPVRYSQVGIDTITVVGMFSNNCVATYKNSVIVADSAAPIPLTICSTDTSGGNITVLDMHIDKYNSTYLTGYYSGQYERLFIAKYDSLGKPVWKYFHPVQAAHSFGLGITSDDAGNAYVTAIATTGEIKIQNKQYIANNFIFKFDPHGNIVWNIQSPNAEWTDIVRGKDGYFYTAGSIGLTDSAHILFTDGEFFNTSWLNDTIGDGGAGFILSFDSDGRKIDYKKFGMSSYDPNPSILAQVYFKNSISLGSTGPGSPTYRTVPKLRRTNTNEIIVTGIMEHAQLNTTYDFDGATLIKNVQCDSVINRNEIFQFRFIPGVGVRKAYTLMGGDIERLEGFYEDGTYSYYCGKVNDYIITTNQITTLQYIPTNNSDFGFVFKADTSGNINWINSTPVTHLHDITADNSSVYVLASGKSILQFRNNTSVSLGLPTQGGSDAAIAAYNQAGNVTGVLKIGGPSDDVAYKMMLDSCGVLHTTSLWNTYDYRYPYPDACNCQHAGDFKLFNYSSGACQNECFVATHAGVTDLGIDSIYVNDTTIGSPSNRVFKIIIRNNGTTPVTSASFRYQLNNTTPVNYNWTGNLDYAEYDSIMLLNISPINSREYRIKTWIDLVNTATDSNHENDSASINQLVCTGPLAGTYTIGSDSLADFTNFSSTLEVLKACGMNAPVRFEAQPGLYKDQMYFTTISGLNATDTLVYTSQNGDSTSVQLEFLPMGYPYYSTLQFDKYVNHVTIKSLTLRNRVKMGDYHIYQATDSTDYITFANNRIECIDETNQTMLFQGFLHNNRGTHYLNNHFYKGSIAINQSGRGGFDPHDYDPETVIRGNIFEGQRDFGIRMYFIYSPVVEKNIFIPDSTYRSNPTAIHLYQNEGNTVISKNIFYQVDTQYTSLGIDIFNAPDSTTGVLVTNNFFRDVTSGAPYYKYAINIAGMNVKILNNTIGRGIKFMRCTGCEVKNNIIFSRVSLHLDSADVRATDIDYNDYYFNDTTNYYQFVYNGVQEPFSQWKTVSGYDLHSTFYEPFFVSSTDNHLTLNNNLPGIPLAQVTDDIDGDMRHPVTPTKGADEISSTADIKEVNNGNGFDYLIDYGAQTLSIRPANLEWKKFTLTSTLGQVMQMETNIGYEIKFNIDRLATGCYIITGVTKQNEILNRKVVIVD
jgi:photosystem II stability/assembly factor-like uncharacterized protein